MNEENKGDKTYLDTIRAFFAEDTYAVKTTGITVEEAEPGRAVVALDADEAHTNAKGGIMGGVMYTMADFASSIADWKEDEINMTVDAQMSYLTGAKDFHLKAVATAQRRGRTIGFYRVDIYDGTGRLIAQGSYTMMHRPR